MKETALAILLLIAFITDMRSMRIPNWLTASAAAAGIALQAIESGRHGLWTAGIGLIAGFAAVVLLHAIGAVGAGDVKLFAAIGALSSATFALSALSYSVLFAACIGLGIVTCKGKLLATVRKVTVSLLLLLSLKNISLTAAWKKSDALQFPFMAAVVPGVLAAYFQLIV
jgi:prepilin peptidase CpaA